MKGRRLFLGRGRGEESLGVVGEVVASVRRVEAFWQHDYLGAVSGSFQDLISSMKEVFGFVRACSLPSAVTGDEGPRWQTAGQLHQSDLGRCFEKGGHGCYCLSRADNLQYWI